MHFESFLALIALALAYTFDFVNGFHDTANAVATVIYTKALRAPVAIVMSGLLNFLGCLLTGTAVAHFIAAVIPHHQLTMPLILSVLIGSIVWNIFTWYHALPVSSSHCLIGGLFGAGVAAHGLTGVNWTQMNFALIALIISPVLGFIGGAFVTWLVDTTVVKTLSQKHGPKHSQPTVLRLLQIFSSAGLSFAHGSNDGQKMMGIITIILATRFPQGGFSYDHIPLWVMATTALSIGLGTAIGGWRIIRTVGSKISREKLSYAQGFGAEFSTAVIVCTASLLGAPTSTTHTLTSAVAGGTVPLHGFQKLNRRWLGLIVWAWLLTLPVTFFISAVIFLTFKLVGLS